MSIVFSWNREFVRIERIRLGTDCGVDIAEQTNCRLEKGVVGERLTGMVEDSATCPTAHRAGHYRMRQFGG